MNNADYIVLVIILLMMTTSYFRGFIRTFFSLVSLIITLAATYYIYPYVSKFVMTQTSFFGRLETKINEHFNLDSLLSGVVTKENQIDAIQKLEVPSNIKEILVNNNNSEIFDLLNVTDFSGYLSGALTSMVLNAIVFIGLFIIVLILLNLLVGVLDLVARLPVFKQVNRFTGALLGAVIALGIIFIGFATLSIVFSMGNHMELYRLIEESLIAVWLYEFNPLMDILNNHIDNSHFWNTIAQ